MYVQKYLNVDTFIWSVYKYFCSTNVHVLIFYVCSGDHGDDDQMNGMVDGGQRPCDVIRITGKKEKCDAAKQALLDLVPITLEVSYIHFLG